MTAESVYDFSGKVALITGGTGALGATLCRLLAEAGASLFLTYRNPEQLQHALRLLPEGCGVQHLSADVTQESEVSRAVGQALQSYGQVDFLCNLAGGFWPGKPLWETPPEVFDSLWETNARSAYLMMRALMPHMIGRNAGKVVNVSARAALTQRAPKSAAYAASKDAVAVLTEIVAKEVRDYNICVNAVAPSIIDTEANRRAMPQADFSRWASREEVAEAVMFLCSDRSSGVRGAVVPVSGRV